MKIGIADYGLNVWYGNLYSYRDRLAMLKELGYEGIERLEVKNQAEAIEYCADARGMGMDFGYCRSLSTMETIRFSAALGLKYVWAESNAGDLDTFCRHVNYQAEAAAKYGLKVGLHNHLGTPVESQDEVEKFLEKCPTAGLVFDAGHLAGAYGDPMYILEKYYDRIITVHVKDFVYKDRDNKNWCERLRFCELGGGEMGDINRDVVSFLVKKNFNGWLCVEHDTHLQDPVIDLKISRDYIRKCGV